MQESNLLARPIAPPDASFVSALPDGRFASNNCISKTNELNLLARPVIIPDSPFAGVLADARFASKYHRNNDASGPDELIARDLFGDGYSVPFKRFSVASSSKKIPKPPPSLKISAYLPNHLDPLCRGGFVIFNLRHDVIHSDVSTLKLGVDPASLQLQHAIIVGDTLQTLPNSVDPWKDSQTGAAYVECLLVGTAYCWENFDPPIALSVEGKEMLAVLKQNDTRIRALRFCITSIDNETEEAGKQRNTATPVLMKLLVDRSFSWYYQKQGPSSFFYNGTQTRKSGTFVDPTLPQGSLIIHMADKQLHPDAELFTYRDGKNAIRAIPNAGKGSLSIANILAVIVRLVGKTKACRLTGLDIASEESGDGYADLKEHMELGGLNLNV